MNTAIGRIKFWQLAIAQFVAAIACVSVWFYYRTKEFLAVSPSGDLYANNWGFQLTAFFAVWLPATLMIVGCLIVVERIFLRRGSSAEGGGSAP